MRQPRPVAPLALALGLTALLGVAGCGRETKNTPAPKLGQQGLEQKTGKAGGGAWRIDTENYLVVQDRRRVVLGLEAADEKTSLPREMNTRLWRWRADGAATVLKDGKGDPVHVAIGPADLLGEGAKQNLPLWLVLRWDLSAHAGKKAAPQKSWEVAWAGLPQELPTFEGTAKLKLYNVDDGKVSDLSGALAPPRVAPLAEADGPGLKVELALRQTALPTAGRLEAVALLAFSASERLMADAAAFAELKGPMAGKPLFDPASKQVGAILYGPVAHSERVFGSAGDGMFFPDLSRNPALLEHFRKWLLSRYGSIETLNDYTGGGHKSFDKVGWKLSTLPDPGPNGKPETYKEWNQFTEAERTMRVQADFLRELRGRHANRALLWLKEKHPQTPVFALIQGGADSGFVERAVTAGDGVVFTLAGEADIKKRDPHYAAAAEDAKTRSGSTKFLAAWLGPEATAALGAKTAEALGQSGFRGLYLSDAPKAGLKALLAFEEAVKTTPVAQAIQSETAAPSAKKAKASLKNREKAQPPAAFNPAAVTGSAPAPPGARPMPGAVPAATSPSQLSPSAPPLRPMDPMRQPGAAMPPSAPLTPSVRSVAPSTVPMPKAPTAPAPPKAVTPPAKPDPAPAADTRAGEKDKEEEFGF